MLCGIVLSFRQSGKLMLCGCFAGLRSFQIFSSLQDSYWRMTNNQSSLRRSRGQSGFAGTNFVPATSHSRYPRSYRQLSNCFRSLTKCIQQLRCRIILLNSLGQNGNPLPCRSLRLILMVQSSEKQRNSWSGACILGGEDQASIILRRS